MEADILDLNARFDELMCIPGDFNAHTNILNDIPENDDFVALETWCDWLAESKCLSALVSNENITSYRYSQDLSPPTEMEKPWLSYANPLNGVL